MKSSSMERAPHCAIDSRSSPAAASPHPVFRQDRKHGSNFLQQVAAGAYPRISQSIELVHSGH